MNKFESSEALSRCVPMSTLQSILSGKWKLLILWYIAFYKIQRFNELFRRLDGITQSTLAKQLKELEHSNLIHREVYNEVPLKVEYSLTELGETFIPILNKMVIWSANHLCNGYTNELIESIHES